MRPVSGATAVAMPRATSVHFLDVVLVETGSRGRVHPSSFAPAAGTMLSDSADQAEALLAVRAAPVLDDLAVADAQDRGAVDLTGSPDGSTS